MPGPMRRRVGIRPRGGGRHVLRPELIGILHGAQPMVPHALTLAGAACSV